jgi:hypothetical protein
MEQTEGWVEMDKSQCIELTAFNYASEAQMFRIKLLSEGIECEIEESNLLGAQPLYSVATGGIKVYVEIDKLGEAQAVLKKYFDDSRSCPQCDSERVVLHTSKQKVSLWSHVLVAITLGAAWFLVYKKYRCEACGYCFN